MLFISQNMQIYDFFLERPKNSPAFHYIWDEKCPFIVVNKLIGIIVVTAALVVLFAVDPEQSAWLPRCPFHVLTGLDCPACGSQRAIHALFHLRFAEAFVYNPFLLLSIPYAAALVLTAWFDPRDRFARLRRFCQSRPVVLTYVFLFCAWWLLRNLI